MATNRERDVRVVVGYKTDAASANAVIQQNRKVAAAVTAELDKTRRAVVSVEDVAGGLNRQFAETARARGIDRMTQDAIEAGRKTKDWAMSLRVVSEELSKIGASDSEIKQVAQSIADAQTGGRGSRRVGGIGSIGREIRALPAIGLGGNLSTDAIGKILYSADAGLTALGATATQVGAASLIAAPAVIGVALAIGEYNKQIDVQKRGLEAALTAQDRYIQSLQQLTTEEARAELARERRNNNFLVSEANNVSATLASTWDSLVAQYGDAGARALTAIGSPFAALQERLDGLNGQIDESDGYILRLRAGIEGGGFAANEAAEAESRLAAERQRLANTTINAVVAADRLTKEEREKRIGQIEREIELLEMFGGTSEATQEQIAELNAEADGLRMVFNSLGDVRAAQAAAGKLLEDSADQQLDAAEKYVEANEAVFKAQQEISEYSAESAQKRLELETAEAEKRQELIAENDERETEIVEDGAEKRAKILKDFNNAYEDAVGERDALAGRQLQKKAQEDLEEQDKAQKKQVEQLERAESKKLQSYQKQFDKQYAQLMNSINNESVLRQNALARANVDAQNAAFLINATQQQYASAAVQAYNVGYLTSSNYIAGLRAGGQGGFNSGTALPPVTGTAANTTINVGGGMTAAQLRSIIQSASGTRGGSGI